MPTEFDTLNEIGIAESEVLTGIDLVLHQIAGNAYDAASDSLTGVETTTALRGVLSQVEEDGKDAAAGRMIDVTIKAAPLVLAGITVTEKDTFTIDGASWGVHRVRSAGLPAFITVRLFRQ